MKINSVKNTIKFILFSIIAGITLYYTCKVFSWKDTAGGYLSSVDTFYELDRDMVDVLFLGSSHCYCSINNSHLWNTYGMASYSLAISGQDLASSYYCLKEALKSQKPKVVCLEVYGSVVHGYQVRGNLYRNVLPYKKNLNFYNAVDSIAAPEDKSDLLLKWPILHTRYRELQMEDFGVGRDTYIGYQVELNQMPVALDEFYSGQECIPIGEEEEMWLHKIIDLAEHEDVELCFFLAPYSMTQEEQKKYAYVRKIAEKRDVRFLNFLELQEEIKIDAETDFIDWAHLNYWGAQKVTGYMGEYLVENYELPDHTGDSEYGLWVLDSITRTHELYNQLMKRNASLGPVLDSIRSYTGYTFVISTSGEYYDQVGDYEYSLADIGIGEEYYEKPATWVIADGEILFFSNEANYEWHRELPLADLEVGSTDGVSRIVIDLQDYKKVTDGINIVVYDNLLEEVVDAVGFKAQEGYACVR